MFVPRQPSSTQIIVTWCGQAADGQPVRVRWVACFRSERIPGATRPICWLMFACGCAGPGNGKYCCPKIYFNHRCFSGPYLNKGRIAELPQFIGPGNCVLVLKEVSRRRQRQNKKTLMKKTQHGEIHGKAIKHVSNGSGPEDPQSQISKPSNALQVLSGLRMHTIVLSLCVYVWERI